MVSRAGRLLSVLPQSLLIVALCATASYAQAPPTISIRVPDPQPRAGQIVSIYVEGTNAAGTTGSLNVIADPVSLGGFARRLPRSTFLGGAPCAADKQCFWGFVYVPYQVRPGDYSIPVTATDTKGRTTTAAVAFHVTAPQDSDNDGLPDFWESQHRLDSHSASGDDGPSGDPDGDGVSNIDEFRAGTNPRGRYTRYFTEGSAGDAQPLRNCITVINPDIRGNTTVQVTFEGDNGRRVATTGYAWGLETMLCPLDIDSVADRVVRVIVDSDAPIAIERDTTSGYAPGITSFPQLTNASAGMQAPSTTWSFADGHTVDGMDMFFLLYNPNPGAVEAEFTYVRAPATVLASKRRVLQPGVRTTVWVNQDDPEVLPYDVSVTITAGAPILAERAFRFHAPGRTVPHDSVAPGASTASAHWYFPDVDGRGPYRSSVMLMNPTDTRAMITATFNFADRAPTSTQVVLNGGERRELAYPEIPVPASTAYGVTLNSTVDVIAERVSTGTTSSGIWRRSALGATELGTRWLFPSAGMRLREGTDVVILNPSDDTARVKLSFTDSTPDSPTSDAATVDVPAHRSVRVPVGANDPGRPIKMLSATTMSAESIANSGGKIVPVVVERTNYWDADGVHHARAVSFIGQKAQ
jgi:hypothetical protein